jgi:sulfocyanin
MPYDTANETVFLKLVAEANPLMPYNYNNTHNGQMVVYVPANWNLRLVFINKEGTTHNAVFLRPYATAPINLTEDGTVLAQIPSDAMQGGFLVSGSSGFVIVRSLTPGTYWVACALTYPTPHAEEGMWIVVKVSTDVTVPYYTIAS